MPRTRKCPGLLYWLFASVSVPDEGSRTGWNEALASSNTRDLRAAIRVAIIASMEALFGLGHCDRFRRGNASHGQRTRQPGPRSGPDVRALVVSAAPPRTSETAF
jgi:hypothetical protein